MMLALALCLAAGDVTVTLPEEASILGMDLTLAQVATVTGADADLVDRLEAFDLGYAPAPGYSRLLHASRIEADLLRTFPDLKVTLAGASSVRVKPQTTTVFVSDLRAEARQALRAHGARTDIEFASRDELQDLVVPLAADSLTLRARFTEPILTSGNLSVPVEVVIDGQLWRTVWTSWRASVYATRPVLLQAVPRGTPIDASLYQLQRVEVRARAASLALSVDDLRHVEAARDLPAGHTLTSNDVARTVITRRNDVVTFVVKKGRIEARSTAVALEAGRIGDRIKVRSASSGRDVVGTLVAKDLVEIVIR